MALSLPMHSEPDAVVRIIGDAHYKGDRLIVGDVDVAKKFASTLGVLTGGKQFGFLEITFTKITVDLTTSSQSFDGAFAEASEEA